MAVTIKDIARKSGCGVATVSSYLNGGNVRPKNREKIGKAISELHYEVNETARQLKTNRTRMVGAIIPELSSTFFAEVLSEIEDILRQHGYALLVCDCRTDPVREKEAVKNMVNRRVDGLFIIPVDASGSNIQKYVQTGKPLIILDRQAKSPECDSVCIDNRQAIRLAVRHLAEHGHRHIGLLVGPEDVNASRQRRKGYLEACLEHGLCISDTLVYQGKDTISTGTEGILHLIEKNPSMTAVVAASYRLTMGAVIGLNESGKQIPGDLSLIGFDHPQFAKALHPSLTIVNQPIAEIGRQAAYVMLQRLKEYDAGKTIQDQQHIWLQAELLPGQSVQDISLVK